VCQPKTRGKTKFIVYSGQTHRSVPTTKRRFANYPVNWKPFDQKIWQRNYYDRVIRNEKELDKIKKYIFENPLKWELDKNNPENLFM